MNCLFFFKTIYGDAEVVAFPKVVLVFHRERTSSPLNVLCILNISQCIYTKYDNHD